MMWEQRDEARAAQQQLRFAGRGGERGICAHSAFVSHAHGLSLSDVQKSDVVKALSLKCHV